MTQNNVRADVSLFLKNYFSENVTQSVRSLARRTKQTRARIQRMKNGETAPLESILAVLPAITTYEETRKFLLRYYPQQFALLDKISDIETKMRADDTTKLLDDPFANRIFHYIDTLGTLEETRLRDEFGAHGIEIANNLVEAELITKQENTFLAISNSNVVFSYDDVLRDISIRAKEFDQANISTGKAYAIYLTRRVSDAQLTKVRAEIRRHYQALNEIVDIEPPDGNPMHFSSMMNTLGPKNTENDE